MRLNVWAALAAFMCASVGAAHAQEQASPQLPRTPEAWREAARSDLEALRTLIEENTPVAVDDENPRMRAWFERG